MPFSHCFSCSENISLDFLNPLTKTLKEKKRQAHYKTSGLKQNPPTLCQLQLRKINYLTGQRGDKRERVTWGEGQQSRSE